MPRIILAMPPLLPIFFIMRCICLCCLSKRLTSWIWVPEPCATRRLREHSRKIECIAIEPADFDIRIQRAQLLTDTLGSGADGFSLSATARAGPLQRTLGAAVVTA